MAPLALLDANVLYPAPLRDLFLWMSYLRVIRAHWTNAIHDEWIRNVARDRGIDRQVLDATRKLMDEHSDDALVSGYEQSEQLFPATDAKDRHVAAAALRVSKDNQNLQVTIVTWNVRHFATVELREQGLRKQNPNAFLTQVFETAQVDVLSAVRRQRANLKNPPQSADELLETLARQNLGSFARLIGAHKDRI